MITYNVDIQGSLLHSEGECSGIFATLSLKLFPNKKLEKVVNKTFTDHQLCAEQLWCILFFTDEETDMYTAQANKKDNNSKLTLTEPLS